MSIEQPKFIDEFQELRDYLPDNMTIEWLRDDMSFWEITFRANNEDSRVRFFASQYAERGEQLPEDDYNEGLCQAQVLCDDKFSVHFIRGDNKLFVPENWNNAPYRYIEGHSWHKIPKSEIDKNYIQIDGKTYFEPDLEFSSIQAVMDQYRVIDAKSGKNNGIEIAIAIFGNDKVEKYLNDLYGKK